MQISRASLVSSRNRSIVSGAKEIKSVGGWGGGSAADPGHPVGTVQMALAGEHLLWRRWLQRCQAVSSGIMACGEPEG